MSQLAGSLNSLFAAESVRSPKYEEAGMPRLRAINMGERRLQPTLCMKETFRIVSVAAVEAPNGLSAFGRLANWLK
jgi:hypothetical protein